MKAIDRINQKIAIFSRKPIEAFSFPVLLGSGIVLLLCILVFGYCLRLPVHFLKNGQVVSSPLGSLLWKARTNRP